MDIEEKVYKILKKSGISEAQQSIETLARKSFCGINHNPYWINKSFDGYFKKGKS